MSCFFVFRIIVSRVIKYAVRFRSQHILIGGTLSSILLLELGPYLAACSDRMTHLLLFLRGIQKQQTIEFFCLGFPE